jgi:hypothetical protein
MPDPVCIRCGRAVTDARGHLTAMGGGCDRASIDLALRALAAAGIIEPPRPMWRTEYVWAIPEKD